MDYSQANVTLWHPMIQLGIIAVTLLVANFIRRGIPFFKRSMMPTAVIGGFVLLIIKLTGLVNIDVTFMEALTYHCIAVGFIALSLRVPEATAQSSGNRIGLKSGAVIVGSYVIQAITGLLVSVFLAYTFMPNLFKASGMLLPLAFGQGPGQANNTGATYEFTWGFSGGRSFGLALAAAGYICACIIGVVLLSILEKKHKVSRTDYDQLSDSESLETFQMPGEIPISESVDKLSIQLALIITIYLITYAVTLALTSFLSTYVPGVASLINGLLWGFNFLIGSGIALGGRAVLSTLQKKNLIKKQYQNNYLLSRISGMVFDVMIVAAITSIEIEDLTGLIAPFILMTVLGAIVTFLHLWYVSKILYKDYFYEGFISMYGMMTGTISSGIILLREIDPQMKTPAANNLVVGSSFAILFGAPILVFVGMAPKSMFSLLLCFVCLIIYYGILMFIIKHQSKPKSAKAA